VGAFPVQEHKPSAQMAQDNASDSLPNEFSECDDAGDQGDPEREAESDGDQKNPVEGEPEYESVARYDFCVVRLYVSHPLAVRPVSPPRCPPTRGDHLKGRRSLTTTAQRPARAYRRQARKERASDVIPHRRPRLRERSKLIAP
jgi:hypothetical protein